MPFTPNVEKAFEKVSYIILGWNGKGSSLYLTLLGNYEKLFDWNGNEENGIFNINPFQSSISNSLRISNKVLPKSIFESDFSLISGKIPESKFSFIRTKKKERKIDLCD